MNMKKAITYFSVVVLCLILTACSSESQDNSSVDLNENESQISETSYSDSVDSSEDDSSETQGLSDYQSVLDEYTVKLQEATPILIEEYQREAAENQDGLNGLAELCNNKVSELAEICNEGVQKMAQIYLYQGSGSQDEYMEWGNKLQDIYMEEAAKIQQEYMNSAK